MNLLNFKLFCVLATSILFLFACNNAASSDKDKNEKNAHNKQDSLVSETKKEDATEKKGFQFPDDWYGTYTGKMHWYAGGKLNAEVPITIEIIPSDKPNEVIWRSTYDSTAAIPRKVVKDYKITHPDSLPKHCYYMDENNGILIDVVHIDNTLYSRFDVAGSNLVSIERLLPGKKLYHEIISTQIPNKKSGDVGDSKGFEVKSTNLITTQKAILERKK